MYVIWPTQSGWEVLRNSWTTIIYNVAGLLLIKISKQKARAKSQEPRAKHYTNLSSYYDNASFHLLSDVQC